MQSSTKQVIRQSFEELLAEGGERAALDELREHVRQGVAVAERLVRGREGGDGRRVVRNLRWRAGTGQAGVAAAVAAPARRHPNRRGAAARQRQASVSAAQRTADDDALTQPGARLRYRFLWYDHPDAMPFTLQGQSTVTEAEGGSNSPCEIDPERPDDLAMRWLGLCQKINIFH